MAIHNDLIYAAEALSDGDLNCHDAIAVYNVNSSILNFICDPLKWVCGQLIDVIWKWMMEICTPLREILDMLLGDPDAIAQSADECRAKGQQVADAANDIIAATESLFADWKTPTADLFADSAKQEVEIHRGVAQAFDSQAGLIDGLGAIVAVLKEIVIGLIKELLSTLLKEALIAIAASAPSLGSSIAAFFAKGVADFVATMARIGNQIADFIDKATAVIQKAGKIGEALLKAGDILVRISTGGKSFGDIRIKVAGYFTPAPSFADPLGKAARDFWKKIPNTGVKSGDKYDTNYNQDNQTSADTINDWTIP